MSIKIDGIIWPVNWVADSVKISADILNGDNSGRMQGSKNMYLEYVGTFYNVEGQIIRGKNCTNAQWDALFETLTDPINQHTLEFPYKQGYMTQLVYIASVNRTLKKQDQHTNKWQSTIDVKFVAMRSMRMAGSSLKGYKAGV